MEVEKGESEDLGILDDLKKFVLEEGSGELSRLASVLDVNSLLCTQAYVRFFPRPPERISGLALLPLLTLAVLFLATNVGGRLTLGE